MKLIYGNGLSVCPFVGKSVSFYNLGLKFTLCTVFGNRSYLTNVEILFFLNYDENFRNHYNFYL